MRTARIVRSRLYKGCQCTLAVRHSTDFHRFITAYTHIHTYDMTGSNGTGNAQQQEEFNYGNPPPLGNPFFGQMLGIPPPPPQDPPMRAYRPNSLSQPFNLVERFKTGKPSLGYGLLLGSPYLARIIGAGGYDWVMIDWEHTPMSQCQPFCNACAT